MKKLKALVTILMESGSIATHLEITVMILTGSPASGMISTAIKLVLELISTLSMNGSYVIKKPQLHVVLNTKNIMPVIGKTKVAKISFGSIAIGMSKIAKKWPNLKKERQKNSSKAITMVMRQAMQKLMTNH